MKYLIILWISGCGIEVYDTDKEQNQQQKATDNTMESPSNDTVNEEEPKETVCNSGTIRYSVRSNSRLSQNSYKIGEKLEGKFYLSAYQYNNDCNNNDVQHYGDQIKNIWIENQSIYTL